jgi:hypothetical protein
MWVGGELTVANDHSLQPGNAVFQLGDSFQSIF